jgi:hypothetical protein
MEKPGRSLQVQTRPKAVSCLTSFLPGSFRLLATSGSSGSKTRRHTQEHWPFTGPAANRPCRLLLRWQIERRESEVTRKQQNQRTPGVSNSRKGFASSSAATIPSGRLPRLYSAIRFFHFRKSVMLWGSIRTSTRRKLASSKFIS